MKRFWNCSKTMIWMILSVQGWGQALKPAGLVDWICCWLCCSIVMIEPL